MIYIFDYIENFIDIRNNSNYEIKDYVKEFIKEVEKLSNDEFCELLLYVYIPESYDDNSSEEKIYTKLIEVLVKVWADRMGFEGQLITTKSSVEDVRIIINNSNFIVCDAKTYRLSRSQKAPNVKDFVQFDSISEWINNAKSSNTKLISIGGLITYTKSHEWSRSSDVYRQCSNPDVPILMLSYDILSIFLKFKSYLKDPIEIISLWDFNNIFKEKINTNNKKIYWNLMNKAIIEIINPNNNHDLNLKLKSYFEFLKNQHTLNIQHQLNKIYDKIKFNKEHISKELKKINDIEILRNNIIEYRTNIINESLLKKIENIEKFRI